MSPDVAHNYHFWHPVDYTGTKVLFFGYQASLMSRNTAKPVRGLGLINKKQNLTIFMLRCI